MVQIAEEKVMRSLDFDYVMDKIQPVTPYGREIKKNMKPFLRGQEAELRGHLDRVETILGLIKDNRFAFIEIRTTMQDVKDLRYSIQRAAKNVTLNSVELFEVKAFLFQLREIAEKLSPFSDSLPKEFTIIPLQYLEELLDPEGTGGKSFYIYNSYSEKLKEIREKKQALEMEYSRLQKELVERARDKLGLNFRPSGEITVSKHQKDMLERIRQYEGLVYLSESYINVTFKVKGTPEMDRIKENLEELRTREQEEEERIRAWLTGEIAKYREEIERNISAVGLLDFYISLAYFARDIKGIKPAITDRDVIIIREGRHPKVEENLRDRGESFQPVTIEASRGVTVITGANMGGKTVTLKMVGLFTLMAQYGIFVPAREMVLGLKDFIYISIGDAQSVDTGLSTFGAEILDMKDILDRCGQRGLILMDELARGTNPGEGRAICAAIVKYLVKGNSTCILTTHFDGIGSIKGVVHLQVGGLRDADCRELKEAITKNPRSGLEIVRRYMDYNLYRINGDAQVPRDAIKIARVMGLKEEILEAAMDMLENRDRLPAE